MFILVKTINSIITILQWFIVADCILSFIPGDSLYDIKEIVRKVTSPFLMPFRRLQQRIIPGLMIDFSPIFAWALLSLIQRIVVNILL